VGTAWWACVAVAAENFVDGGGGGGLASTKKNQYDSGKTRLPTPQP